MRILSLDQSSAVTGYAVIENSKYEQSGVLDMRRNHDSENRVKNMMLLVGQLIGSKKVDCVVMEDAHQQSNFATFKMLSRIQGAIMYYCYEKEIPFYIMSPSAWRSALNFEQGKGVKRWKLKQQAIDFVEDACGKTVCDDEADAICIGFAAVKNNIFESEG